MKEDSNDTKSIKDYLIEKNKNLVSDTMSAFKDPIKDIGSVLESLKPQNLVKNFSAISGTAPVLSSINNKLSDIDGNITNFILGQNQDRKHEFLKEALAEREVALQEKSNKFLEEIANQDGVDKSPKDDKKSSGILKTLMGAGGAIGGMGVAGLAGKAMGGMKKMGKIALKGLGKVALPLAALLSAKDFYEGFGNALEITGRDDFSAKMQAGLSSVVSGLTFGLIDAKTISQSLDKAQDAIFGFILNPLKTMRDFSEKYNILEHVDKALTTFTFGLIDVKMIKNGINAFKEHIVNLFTDPIEALKTGARIYLNIGDMVNTALSFLSGGLIPEGIFEEKMMELSSHLNDIFVAPFIKIKTWFEELDINGFINRMIEPLVAIKNSIFSGDIFAPLTDWFANFDLIEMLGIGPLLEKVRIFKESIINIAKNPFKFVSDFLTGKKDEDIVVKKPNKKISPRDDRNPNYRSTTDDIKESYMQKGQKKGEKASETNTQTIINNNTNNNIIRDDMSMQTSDPEYGRYAY